MKVQDVELARLRPHPSNPRGKIKPEDVAELAKSIGEVGLLQPLTVTRDPERAADYVVIAGCRRLAALHSMGEPTASCVVLEADETDEETILLADNIHREDLDPVLAGRLVERMLGKPEATVASVAKSLGKSVRWVAQVRALGGLSKAWIKRRAEEPEVARLSLSDLALIAGLSEEAQARLAKSLHAWDLEPRRFRDRLAAETLRLAAAPWDLEDATLDPKAGACSKCPKTSLGSPGLFDGAGEPGDLKRALCLDVECFRRKVGACVAGKIAAARREHGANLIVLERAPGESFSGARAVVEADNLLRSALRDRKIEVDEGYGYSAVKGKSGGVPAYVLGGRRGGEVVLVRVPGEPGTPGPSKRKPPKGQVASGGPNAAEKRRLARLVVVLELARKAVLVLEVPAATLVLGLARVYGLNPAVIGGGPKDLKQAQDLVAQTDGAPAFAASVWPDLRDAIATRFDDPGNTLGRQRCEPEVRWLAEVLELPIAAYEATALEKVPEPRARGDVKPKSPAKAKGPRKSKTKAAAK